jgi:hypothetical protein
MVDVLLLGLAALTAASHVPGRKPPSTFSHSLKGVPIYLTIYAFLSVKTLKNKGVTFCTKCTYGSSSYEKGRLGV